MDCRLRRRALDSCYYAFAILTRAQAGEVKEESTVNYFMVGEEKIQQLLQPTAVCLSVLKPFLILCPCCVYVCVCIPNTRRGGEEINSHLHCNCVCIMRACVGLFVRLEKLVSHC